MADLANWTIMIYMAGDNNLDLEGVADLMEMKGVGSSKLLNLIAQFDRQGEAISTNRYYLTKEQELSEDLVESLGETNTGDPCILESFISWGIENYPAKYYLVILWGHGNGWNDANFWFKGNPPEPTLSCPEVREAIEKATRRDAVSAKDVGLSSNTRRNPLFFPALENMIARMNRFEAIDPDDSHKDYLDNLEIKWVFNSAMKKAGQKIDILGMDACLMGMVEEAYQLRDSVRFMVASEELQYSSDGWPYGEILNALSKCPDMQPEKLAGVIVKKFIDANAYISPATLSACDLAVSEELAKAIDGLAKSLINNLTVESTEPEFSAKRWSNFYVREALLYARKQVQQYDIPNDLNLYLPENVDLYHFCHLLNTLSSSVDIKNACRQVMNVISDNEKCFVRSAGYTGKEVENSHGIAIYFPVKSIEPTYARLDLTENTDWEKFLEVFIDKASWAEFIKFLFMHRVNAVSS